MVKMDSEIYRKSIFTLIFLVLFAIAFIIVKPLLTAVLTGIVLSYIFYPVYKKLNLTLKSRNLSSLIVTLIVILVITMPLFFILNTISKEAYTTYLLSRQKLSANNILGECQPADNTICRSVNYFAAKANEPQIKYYIETTLKEATNKVTHSISQILFTIPIYLLHIFVVIFVMFFLFRDGEVLINKVEKILPLKEKDRIVVFKRLNDMSYAVVYGSIIIAVIQGALGGIGFFIFGLPSPIIWAIVMTFAALIPYVGSTIIWLPTALLMILNGYIDSETGMIVKGILFMLYGAFIISTIDNILKPKIIGDKGGLHPVLVLIGVIGGLNILGFIGIIVGPLILAMFVTFVNIFEEEKT
jgi:predicted PurR-regulated permease PerM